MNDEGSDIFRHVAHRISVILGTAGMFWAAVAVVAIWAALGPTFGYSDTWQLVINTSTTIITFLMVFIIQNTQNRDNKALHLKLDEVLKAMKGARNSMIDLDRLSDKQLSALEAEYKRLCDASGDTPPPAQPDGD